MIVEKMSEFTVDESSDSEYRDSVSDYCDSVSCSDSESDHRKETNQMIYTLKAEFDGVNIRAGIDTNGEYFVSEIELNMILGRKLIGVQYKVSRIFYKLEAEDLIARYYTGMDRKLVQKSINNYVSKSIKIEEFESKPVSFKLEYSKPKRRLEIAVEQLPPKKKQRLIGTLGETEPVGATSPVTTSRHKFCVYCGHKYMGIVAEKFCGECGEGVI